MGFVIGVGFCVLLFLMGSNVIVIMLFLWDGSFWFVNCYLLVKVLDIFFVKVIIVWLINVIILVVFGIMMVVVVGIFLVFMILWFLLSVNGLLLINLIGICWDV